MPTITSVRIVDPYVLELIETEQSRAREATPTKTAQRMIVERAAQGNRHSVDDLKGSPSSSLTPTTETNAA